LHGRATPLFGLQQALGIYAAITETPTCVRFGDFSSEGIGSPAAVCRASTAPGSLRNALASSVFVIAFVFRCDQIIAYIPYLVNICQQKKDKKEILVCFPENMVAFWRDFMYSGGNATTFGGKP
jgi:hypothetical protein